MLKILTSMVFLSFTLMANANYEVTKSSSAKVGEPKSEFLTQGLNYELETREKDGLQDFNINNRSSQEICNIYISPDYSTSWEEDVLGTRTLRPNQSIRITMNGYGNHCMFDVRVRTCSGITLDKRVDLCTVENYNLYD